MYIDKEAPVHPSEAVPFNTPIKTPIYKKVQTPHTMSEEDYFNQDTQSSPQSSMVTQSNPTHSAYSNQSDPYEPHLKSTGIWVSVAEYQLIDISLYPGHLSRSTSSIVKQPTHKNIQTKETLLGITKQVFESEESIRVYEGLEGVRGVYPKQSPNCSDLPDFKRFLNRQFCVVQGDFE